MSAKRSDQNGKEPGQEAGYKAIQKQHPLHLKKLKFIDALRDEKRLSLSSVHQYARELDILFTLLPDFSEISAVRAHLKKLAPATAVRKLIIWKSFLQTCDEKWAKALEDIQSPKIRQKQPLFLTEQEAFLLEQACYRSSFLNRDRLLVALMLQLGLRLAEVLHLKFQDFEGDWIRLMRKGEKEQRLPLSPTLKTLFEAWRNERHASPSDFIFGGRTNESLTSRGAQVVIDRLRKDAKIEKKITPHSLRHTFASTLAAKGASLAALKEILGHRKITTTERYLHVTPDHLRETLNLMK